MRCPDCGTENPDDAKICIGCGKGIEWWRIRVKGRVGRLDPGILASLDAIPKSYRREKVPAEAVLGNGIHLPCVLFLEVTDQTRDEYIYPVGPQTTDYDFDEKTRRRVVWPEQISSVIESRYRTPTALERKMHGPGFHEYGMDGPFMCRLILDDGSEYLMKREDWDTEFIVLPDDIPNSRISEVLPVSTIFDVRRLEDAGRELPEPGVKYCMFMR